MSGSGWNALMWAAGLPQASRLITLLVADHGMDPNRAADSGEPLPLSLIGMTLTLCTCLPHYRTGDSSRLAPHHPLSIQPSDCHPEESVCWDFQRAWHALQIYHPSPYHSASTPFPPAPPKITCSSMFSYSLYLIFSISLHCVYVFA